MIENYVEYLPQGLKRALLVFIVLLILHHLIVLNVQLLSPIVLSSSKAAYILPTVGYLQDLTLLCQM